MGESEVFCNQHLIDYRLLWSMDKHFSFKCTVHFNLKCYEWSFMYTLNLCRNLISNIPSPVLISLPWSIAPDPEITSPLKEIVLFHVILLLKCMKRGSLQKQCFRLHTLHYTFLKSHSDRFQKRLERSTVFLRMSFRFFGTTLHERTNYKTLYSPYILLRYDLWFLLKSYNTDSYNASFWQHL